MPLQNDPKITEASTSTQHTAAEHYHRQKGILHFIS